MQIQKQLFSMQDMEYREFNSKLIPTVDPARVIGVRTPELRGLAKRIKSTPEADEFLSQLPHGYYEENNLHAFLIEQIRDYDVCMEELKRFLPYVDNWATCDSMRPKCLGKNKGRLFAEIEGWLSSDHIYTVRYGIEMLMTHFLDDDFDVRYPEMVAEVADLWDSRTDHYYVNMMAAWYFATALAKQYESIIPYLEKRRLPVWVYNKTIQKAVESYRITPEQKMYLRGLRTNRKNEQEDGNR